MKRHYLYAVIAIVACLAMLEALARTVESALSASQGSPATTPGWQQKFFGSVLDWHEADPDLLWRFKQGLDNPLIKTNSDHLLGNEIPTRKGPDNYRILLLGDSSPVGLGLTSRKLAFGEITRYLLDRRAGGRKIVELINAAVSGYTSAQMVRYLTDRGWRYQPDLVILYCGNNDASISGYFSDPKLLSAQRFKVIRSLLSRSAFYRLLRSVLVRPRGGGAGGVADLKIRVSPEHFGENLDNIYRQCLKRECPLIILKPPVPYLWPAGLQFKPFLHLTDRQGDLILPPDMAEILGRDISYCLDENRFRQIYGRGDIFTRAVYSSAFVGSVPGKKDVDYYQKQIIHGSADPVLYNNLGVALWREGNFIKADSMLKAARHLFVAEHGQSPAVRSAGSPILFNIGINLLSKEEEETVSGYDNSGSAFAYLDSALEADYFSLRIKTDYWREIDRFNNREGVAVIDLPAIFRGNGGERLFIDHCHPTAEGHRLVARELVEAIMLRNWL